MGTEGKLEGKQMFIVTDNQVFESTYYKGHSALTKLNSIIF